MILKRLSYFTAVVEAGSISAASRALHIAQPPLSAQIRLLEEEVGCQLLVREARRVRVTEAGRMLYDRACALLRQSEETMRALQDYRDGAAGTLRVGVVSSVAGGDFARWAASFHRACPQVRFAVTEANTYKLIDAVRKRSVELALVRTPYHAPELAAAPLAEQSTCVLSAQPVGGDPTRSAISLGELAHEPLILYRRWEKIVLDAFAAQNLTAHITFVTDDARTSAALAANGAGCALVPASAAVNFPSLFQAQVSCEALCSRIDVVWDEHAYRSTSALRFSEHILREAGRA